MPAVGRIFASGQPILRPAYSQALAMSGSFSALAAARQLSRSLRYAVLICDRRSSG